MPPPNPRPLRQGTAEFFSFPFARELTRGVVAFALYLLAYPLWTRSGLRDLYGGLLHHFAQAVLAATQHFSSLPEPAEQALGGFHTHAVLVFVLGLVSTRVPWRRRLQLFGAVLIVVVLTDLLSAALAVQLRTAKELYEQRGVLLLLPREFNAVEFLWYLVYVVPLQAGPFALLALTALWNSGFRFPGRFSPAGAVEGEGPRLEAERVAALRGVRSWRLIGGASLGVALIGGITISIWARLRESDPLHVEAHVRLGNLLFENGDLESAEEEYRAAVGAGSRDGEAWYRLAQIRSMEGDAEASSELLRRGLGVVSDPTWRDWMRRAAGTPKMDPGRGVPTIVVVEPPEAR